VKRQRRLKAQVLSFEQLHRVERVGAIAAVVEGLNDARMVEAGERLVLALEERRRPARCAGVQELERELLAARDVANAIDLCCAADAERSLHSITASHHSGWRRGITRA
jgi:hypothetical protein